MDITNERAKEILSKYYNPEDAKDVRQGKYLFNWCEEYKNFINSCVGACVSMEWDYMLKKSYEDSESPVSYEDLPLMEFDQEKAEETIKQEVANMDEEQKTELLKELSEQTEGGKEFKTIEEFLNTLKDYDEDDFLSLKEEISYFNHLEEEDFKKDIEIYEWWIISDPLKYRLEQEGEVFLNGAWGRQATGQGLDMDRSPIRGFINLLHDRTGTTEEDFKQ